ncbi:nitrous oxide reductase accessory protein NosL [Roseibium salinum]|nr:nitrous oxide reductase accessory protein NosL [Roseibium salinum]
MLGSAPAGTLGVDRLTITVASLASLSVYLVPLIALLLAFDAICGEVERGTLLMTLSCPISRSEFLVGKALGHTLVLAFALVAGYGLTAGLLVALGAGSLAGLTDFVRLIATSVLLGICFLAIGYVLSTLTRQSRTAAAASIAVWLFLVVLYDLALPGRARRQSERRVRFPGLPLCGVAQSGRRLPSLQPCRPRGKRSRRRDGRCRRSASLRSRTGARLPGGFRRRRADGIGHAYPEDCTMKRSAIVLLALGLLTACQEDVQVARPAALDLTPEAAGHYCQMTVLDHSGPKAQIHLTGNPNPFWFTQVRDAVAFTLSPEEPKNIAAIYVNDMDKAESWDQPGTDNWIEADSAWFVIGSTQAGGMGAAEAIPFGSQAGGRNGSFNPMAAAWSASRKFRRVMSWNRSTSHRRHVTRTTAGTRFGNDNDLRNTKAGQPQAVPEDLCGRCGCSGASRQRTGASLPSSLDGDRAWRKGGNQPAPR